MRVFISIDINNDLKQKLSETQYQLTSLNCDIKWVEKENLHFTLKFIGEINEIELRNIKLVLRKLLIDKLTFTISIENLGTFPEKQSPRIIWAGVNKGKDQLCFLSKIINDELEKIGIKREAREFIPHLTLGRIRSKYNIDKLTTKINEISNSYFGESVVNKIILMQSILTQKGPIYTSIEEYNLCE